MHLKDIIVTRFISVILVYLIFFSCQDEFSDKVPGTLLFPVDKYLFGHDSIILSDYINLLNANDSLIVVSDVKHNNIHIANNKDNFYKSLDGKKGKGPEDILEVKSMLLRGDNLLIFDEGNQKIVQWNYIRDKYNIWSYPFKEYGLGRIEGNLDIGFYKSSISYSKPLVRWDTFGIINTFGSFFPYDDEKHKRANAYSHIVLTEENHLMVISLVFPAIRTYNLDGQLLDTFRFDKYFNFHQKWMEERIETDPSNKYVVMSLFDYVYYHRGILYLLYREQSETGNESNFYQVMEMNYNNSVLELTRNIEFRTFENEKPYISAFAVNDEYIYIFDRESAEILIYDKP